MIHILVADDSQEKQQKIKNVLDKYFGKRENISVDYVQDVVNAKRVMQKDNVDILILDLYLPESFESGPKMNGGISLINQTYKSTKYKYPEYVISLSRYKEAMKEFKKETGKVHRAIFYEDISTAWADELVETLNFIIPCLENNASHRCYQYDVAVVCALEEELDYVKEMLSDIRQVMFPMDDNIYFSGTILKDDKKIKVIATSALQMGMVATAALTTNMIHNFIPKYVIMTGIAAGIKNKVNLGDAVVAEFSWDYGAGKEIVEENGYGRHLNTFQPVQADATLLSKVRLLQQDKAFMEKIAEGFHGKKPDTRFKIVIGPMATGAAVIADPEKVQSIMENQTRNVVAIEMEAYGMYYAANWSVNPKPKFLAIKSICDYADQKKDDNYHEYAAYTSVKVFEKLAKEYFEY